MNLVTIFLLLLTVRLFSVFVVKTFYVPDEYWQSLEVAHKIAFGYGYLTWEWEQGIRNYIYPLAIAGIFKILALLNLDTVYALVLTPRVFQAMLSTYSDYRFFIWCGKKKWALFCIVVSWFWFYMASRTLSNTLEISLTNIALSYYPWQGEGIIYFGPAALCCFLRPTSVILWSPLVLYHIKKSKLSLTQLIFKRFIIIGAVTCVICISIDSLMHGQLLVTPYEFLKYNVYHNVGSFYGSHPWHWYFTIGLPTVLGISFVPFLFGVIETIRHRKTYPTRKVLLITIFIVMVVLSAVEHKEFRFVGLLLPLCLYITSDTLTKWSYNASKVSLWCTALLLIIGNCVPALYLSTVHQRGPLEVMNKLQDIAYRYRDEYKNPARILFLMPCHSTPYYSHIHRNVTMRFLTCEPNLKQKVNYKDEADQFYDSPTHWLRSHVPSYPPTAKPTHVVLYEPLVMQIKDFLVDYKRLYIVANAEYTQARTGKNILVYQRLRGGEQNLYNREEYKEEQQFKQLSDLKEHKNEDNLIDGEDEFGVGGNMFN